jgi:hypothetical protein
MKINIKMLGCDPLEITDGKSNLLGSYRETIMKILEVGHVKTGWSTPQCSMEGKTNRRIRKPESIPAKNH